MAFDARQGWRDAKVAELRERLAHHWAETTLAVVRQGDPLAFGIERLREARATVAADLDKVRVGIPRDVSHELLLAQVELDRARKAEELAHHKMRVAEENLELASRRRWGRIDRTARDRAVSEYHSAEDGLARTGRWVTEAESALSRKHGLQEEREQALAATEAKRDELSKARADLEAALEATLPERVLALAGNGPTSLHVMERLGPLPEGAGQRAVWCALAAEAERFHDRHPGRDLSTPVNRWLDPDLYEDQLRLKELLEQAPELLAVGDQLFVSADPLGELSAESWALQLDRAQELLPRLPEPALERSLGTDLGW